MRLQALCISLLALASCSAPGLESRLAEIRHGSTLRPIGVARVLDCRSAFSGSCFAVSTELLVTAHHVVEGLQGPLTVDGRPAELVALDRELDLAVLRCPGHGLPVLRLREAALGEPARAAGYVGQEAVWDGSGWTGSGATVTAGTVSSVDAMGWLGFDGGAQPGMSGGPLLGADGAALGVLSRCLSWDSVGSVNSSMARHARAAWVVRLLSDVRPDSPALPPPPELH